METKPMTKEDREFIQKFTDELDKRGFVFVFAGAKPSGEKVNDETQFSTSGNKMHVVVLLLGIFKGLAEVRLLVSLALEQYLSETIPFLANIVTKKYDEHTN